jgi:TetR/AcrR family fatty acid metabolism transcriptional regulator
MSANTKVQAFKKGLIVETARALFIENTFDAVTVEDIARAAGFGKSTVYLFFESKEEILAAVIHQGIETLSQELYSIDERGETPITALRLFIPLQYAFFCDFGSLFFTFSQKCKIGAIKSKWMEDIGQLIKKKTALLAHVLQKGIEEEIFISSDPDYLAWFFNSLIKGVCMPSIVRQPELRDKEKDLLMLETIILNGMVRKQ